MSKHSLRQKRSKLAYHKFIIPAGFVLAALALVIVLPIVWPRESSAAGGTDTLDLSTYTRNVHAGVFDGITDATRGYFDTTPSAHASGSNFYVYSGIHLSTAGYGAVAQAVAAFLQANPSIYDHSQVTIWGDSLTQSAFPGKLGSALGITAHGEGVAGQTSVQIGMREGGLPVTMTVAGNSVRGGDNTVTAINDRGFPSPYSFLYSPASLASRSVHGTLGSIPGTLLSTDIGTKVPATEETYTFTPDNASLAPTSVPPDTTFTVDNGTLNDGTVVIWAGRNDFKNPTQVEDDIAAMVAHLGSNHHYVVLSVLNQDSPAEYAGQPDHDTITALNDYLAATYPGHYLDVRTYLIQHGLATAGITPTVLDSVDIANDAPPTSLHLVEASGILAGALDATDTSFSLQYTVGSAGANQLISLGGTERIRAGAGSGTLYTVVGPDGTLAMYPETDSFNITTGSGNDTVIGSASHDVFSTGDGTDSLEGLGGPDTLTGGGAGDTFIYLAASDSTSRNYDTVVGFNAYSDKFDVPGTVSAVAPAIDGGTLVSTNFDANLQTILTAARLPAHNAVLLTPKYGDYANYQLLIIDTNGVAGYQAGQDLVIRLVTPGNITHLATSDFI